MRDLKLDIEITEPFQLQIEAIIKYEAQQPINASYINRATEYQWEIETKQGSIFFKSVGYKQFVRQKPKLLDTQLINFVERGGICFDRIDRH